MIFVFGSNLAGRHGAGAARVAWTTHGAQYGRGVGHIGNSYAIPTKDRDLKSLHLDEIAYYIRIFIQYAKLNPDLYFYITPIGCGLAGFTPELIAPFFRNVPDNCTLPKKFLKVLNEPLRRETTP